MIHEPTKSEKGRCVCSLAWAACDAAESCECIDCTLSGFPCATCGHKEACHAPPQPAAKPLTAEAMEKGAAYNWKHSPSTHLTYLGHNWSSNGYWHQFALLDDPHSEVWREVLASDLHMLERTPVPDHVEDVRTMVAPPVEDSRGMAAERQAMSDEVYSALIYALWRHQGGSSHIGQPLREILGKGQFDELTTAECANAKIVHSALTGTTADSGRNEAEADHIPGAREVVRWLAATVQAMSRRDSDSDTVTIDDETRTVGDLLDAANALLEPIAPVASPDERAAIDLLSDLATALDGAFISSWQSSAAWRDQLDRAMEFLAARSGRSQP